MTLEAPADGRPFPEAPPPQAVGYRAPPLSGRFRPGVSGNPQGRPRRAAMAAARGRAIAAEPTELERALAQPVISHLVDAAGPISLAQAVVARLTDRALNNGDVAACRELLRLCAEAEAVAAERALLAAEQAEAEERAAQAAAREEAERARAAEETAQNDARFALELMAEQAAFDAGEETWDDDDRALCLLDAVEMQGARRPAVKPWVVEAARARDPALPRGGDRPLDPAEPFDALRRLDVLTVDPNEEHRLKAWFIDAARARRPQARFAKGDEALLQLLRWEDDGREDWPARLAAVEGRRGDDPAAAGETG